MTIPTYDNGREILWRRENIYLWSPMTSDGAVLLCPMWSSADEKLYVLDCRTGKTIWAKSRMANHYNPPVTLTLTPGDPAALIQEARKARRFVERLVGVES